MLCRECSDWAAASLQISNDNTTYKENSRVSIRLKPGMGRYNFIKEQIEYNYLYTTTTATTYI